MTTEAVQTGVETANDTVPAIEETEVVVVSPYEEEAQGQGWMPKDKWVELGNSEEDWRSAREFVERGEIFKTNHSLKRELQRTQLALTALQRHHQYVFEKAHQKALTDLRKERREAVKEEDADRIEKIEEEIQKVENEHQQSRVQLAQESASAAVVGPHPDFTAWVGRNTWYQTDTELREYADAVGLLYMQKNPGTDPTDVLKHVESRVRKQFSDKFGARRAAPNAVSVGDRTYKKSASDNIVLDEMETKIMNDLVAAGEMTAAEYKKELKKARGY